MVEIPIEKNLRYNVMIKKSVDDVRNIKEYYNCCIEYLAINAIVILAENGIIYSYVGEGYIFEIKSRKAI